MPCGTCPGCGVNTPKKPISQRIPQVILVFFIVWLVACGFLGQSFSSPSPNPKKRKNKYRHRKQKTWNEKLVMALTSFDYRVWLLIALIIISLIFIVKRIIKIQEKQYEQYVQDKWNEVMENQKQQEMNENDSDSDSYDGPKIRELVDDEDEENWKKLIEKEKKKMEKKELMYDQNGNAYDSKGNIYEEKKDK